MRRAISGPLGLWAAFVVVHAVLGWLALTAPGWPLGDVQFTYVDWATRAVELGRVVGVDEEWVYPPLAIVPVLLPALAGTAWYPTSWLVMVAALNAVALGALTSWAARADRRPIGWWWLGFLLLLGPIAVGRLDAVTVALGVIAAAVIARRPAVAGVLLAAGAWIKVWPAGVLAVAVVALRSRLQLTAAALGTSVAVLAAGILAGGSLTLLSFVTEQAERGLQVEAVIATPWMIALAAGSPGVEAYYDTEILTYQLAAPGAAQAAAATTPALAVAVLAVLGLALLAVRRGADGPAVLAPAALAMTLALIVLNKVGSPQFTAWVAVPVVLALVLLGRGAWLSWRAAVVGAAAMAALTHLVYPVLYERLLVGDPLAVAVLTARNAVSVALLAWAVAALARVARRPAAAPSEGTPS